MDPNKKIFRYSGIASEEAQIRSIYEIRAFPGKTFIRYAAPMSLFAKGTKVEITGTGLYDGCHDVVLAGKAERKNGIIDYTVIINKKYAGDAQGIIKGGCEAATAPNGGSPNGEEPNGGAPNGGGPNGGEPEDKITQFVKKNKITVVAGALLLIALIWYLIRRR